MRQTFSLGDQPRFFFNPVQLHFQPADLPVKFLDELVFVLLPFLPPIGEEVDEALSDHTFPVPDLSGLHLVVPGQFS